jgi:hypothetical protein
VKTLNDAEVLVILLGVGFSTGWLAVLTEVEPQFEIIIR